MAPRGSFVALVLIACGLGAVVGLSRPGEAKPVELKVRELVRVHGGQAVLVLQEAGGDRRLPIPLTKAEAALIAHPQAGLAPRTVEALGGRVLGATIDEISGERGFRAHLSLGSGSRELRVDATAGEALTLAVQAGAPIRIEASVLDAAAVSPEDLRGRAVREVTHDPTPAPVLRI